MMQRIAAARVFFRKLWALARPYWFAQERQRSSSGALRHPQGGVDRARAAGDDHRAERAQRLHGQAVQRLERPLLQCAAGQERRGVLGRADLLGGAGDIFIAVAVYRAVSEPAADHPLAPLAQRGVLPRLADRSHLLPAGDHQPAAPTTPSSASSRTARRSPPRRSS